MSKQFSSPSPAPSAQTVVSNPKLAAKPVYPPPGAVGSTSAEVSPGGKLDTNGFRRHLNKANRNFEGCDLSGVSMCGLDLNFFTFTGANLAKADMRLVIAIGTNFVNTDLTGADLTEANLAQAKLGGSKLAGAKLAGACLRQTEFAGTSFEGADLTGAIRDPEDPKIPGWTVVNGRLRKVTN